MQGLLDALGLPTPASPDAVPTKLSSKFTLRDFSRAVLDSAEYRQSIFRRIQLDELPSAVECMFYHYAGGKPIERVEVEDKTLRLEDAPRDVLEQRLRQLTDLVEHLRMNDEMNAALSEDDSGSSPSVH